MIDIVIPFRPVPKGRPRMTKTGHTYTPKATADFEKKVREYVGLFVKSPLLGPLAVKMEFVFEPPKSWSKKKREQAIGGLIQKITKPDVSNLIKAAEDALNGICYQDDSAIIKIEANKKYGKGDQVSIQITRA